MSTDQPTTLTPAEVEQADRESWIYDLVHREHLLDSVEDATHPKCSRLIARLWAFEGALSEARAENHRLRTQLAEAQKAK